MLTLYDVGTGQNISRFSMGSGYFLLCQDQKKKVTMIKNEPLVVRYPGMETLSGLPEPPPVILIWAHPTNSSGDPAMCNPNCSMRTRYCGFLLLCELREIHWEIGKKISHLS